MMLEGRFGAIGAQLRQVLISRLWMARASSATSSVSTGRSPIFTPCVKLDAASCQRRLAVVARSRPARNCAAPG